MNNIEVICARPSIGAEESVRIYGPGSRCETFNSKEDAIKTYEEQLTTCSDPYGAEAYWYNKVLQELKKSSTYHCPYCEDRDCEFNAEGMCFSPDTILSDIPSGMYTCSGAKYNFTKPSTKH